MIKKIIFVLLMLITLVSCNHQVKEKIVIDIPGKNGALNLGENKTEHYIFYVFKNPAKDYINREYIVLVFVKGSGSIVDIYHTDRLTISEIEKSNESLFNSANKRFKLIETYENNKLIRSIDQSFYVWITYNKVSTDEYGKESICATTNTFAYNDYGRIGGNYYNSIDKINSKDFISISYSISNIIDYSYYIDELTGKEVTEAVNHYEKFELDPELD